LDILLVEDLAIDEVDHGHIADAFHLEPAAPSGGRHTFTPWVQGTASRCFRRGQRGVASTMFEEQFFDGRVVTYVVKRFPGGISPRRRGGCGGSGRGGTDPLRGRASGPRPPAWRGAPGSAAAARRRCRRATPMSVAGPLVGGAGQVGERLADGD